MASSKQIIHSQSQEVLEELAAKSKKIRELLDLVWPIAKTLPRVTHELWQVSGTANSIEEVIGTMFGSYDCPSVELDSGGLKNGNKAIHAMFKFLDKECHEELAIREAKKAKDKAAIIVTEWLAEGCPPPNPAQREAILAAM